MGELVLVRHAQASFGTSDYDRLSPLGLQQSDWLGCYFRDHGLHFNRVIRGTLRRHRETLNGIASRHVLCASEIDPRLDEFHYEGLEKQYLRETGADAPSERAQFLSVFPEVFTRWELGQIDGGGETYLTFRDRISAAITDATALDQTVLIVTSGGVIGTLIRNVLGLDAYTTAELLLNIHNASVHRLVWEGGKLRLSLFNASPHLDPEDRAHARTYI